MTGCKEEVLLIPALDGLRLAATVFAPEKSADNGVVVQINGATGVRRGYYAHYARYLCARGFHVVTYDYRGIGDSLGQDPDSYSMQDWGEKDLAGVTDWIAGRYPRHRLVCVGHSGGGQWLGLARNNHKVCGQLAVSAQSGFWAHWRLRDWPRMLFYWYLLFPLAIRLCNGLPGGLLGGDRLPRGIARNWVRWCRHRHYICDRRGAPIREHFHAYRGRMRFYVITDDARFAPPDAVRALAGFYANAGRQIVHLIPQDYAMRRIGHFGFFRSDMAARAWQETADWLHEAAYPSALQQAV